MAKEELITVSLDTQDGRYQIFDPFRDGPVIIDVVDGFVKVTRSDLATVLKSFSPGREVSAPEPSDYRPDKAVQEKHTS